MEIKGLKHSSAPRNHFASDNNAPVHPAVIEAIVSANKGHALAYGDDFYTERATKRFRQVFGKSCQPFFLFTGTGANVLSVAALTRPYNAVICAGSAHINEAECGATEKFAGVKLLTAPSDTGKITVSDIEAFLDHQGDQHHVQAKLVSLTQPTDFGLHYTVRELGRICEFAHQHDMYVHMDGARLYNACAALGVSLREMTSDIGLDLLSLGGTKNGLLSAEAVLFFKPQLADGFRYIRKQGMQLASKMRFLAVQMEALLIDGLWLTNAQNANRMAQMLAEGLRQIPGINITREVQTNMVFCIIPPQCINMIREHYLFYVCDEKKSEVRLVTSYDTTEDDIRGFIEVTKKALT
jgi:threonine aldolase